MSRTGIVFLWLMLDCTCALCAEADLAQKIDRAVGKGPGAVLMQSDLPRLYVLCQKLVYTRVAESLENPPKKGGDWKKCDEVCQIASRVLGIEHVPLKSPFTAKEEKGKARPVPEHAGPVDIGSAEKLERERAESNSIALLAVDEWWHLALWRVRRRLHPHDDLTHVYGRCGYARQWIGTQVEIDAFLQGMQDYTKREALAKIARRLDGPQSEGEVTNTAVVKVAVMLCDLRARDALLAMIDEMDSDEETTLAVVEKAGDVFAVSDLPRLYVFAQRDVQSPEWTWPPTDGHWDKCDVICQLASRVLRIPHKPLKSPFTEEELKEVKDKWTVYSAEQPKAELFVGPSDEEMKRENAKLNARAMTAIRDWWLDALKRANDGKKLRDDVTPMMRSLGQDDAEKQEKR